MKSYEKDGKLYWDGDILLSDPENSVDYRLLCQWAKIDFYLLERKTIVKMLVTCRETRNKRHFEKANEYISELIHVLERKEDTGIRKLTVIALWMAAGSLFFHTLFKITQLFFTGAP
jgi:hypothetical protein